MSTTHRNGSTGSTEANSAATALDAKLAELREKQKAMRAAVGIYRSPLYTFGYFLTKVIPERFVWLLRWLAAHQKWVAATAVLLVFYTLAILFEGPQQQTARDSFEFVKICAWWVLLGVLSSIGLGTGLHTFVLYLGPFIASVTLAATECNSTAFERYGPASFICPENSSKDAIPPAFFDIFKLVVLEAFLWGAGTAIGELPPYFVARAARLAGERVKELDEGAEEIQQDNSFFGRLKQMVFSKLGNLGFFGIMLFASIPNPLFDLAGLTCGHMLVPFWTFFGATLIGKAVIKVSLQTIFVVTVFSKDHLETAIHLIEKWIPALRGSAIQAFESMRKQYHRKPGQEMETGSKHLLAWGWDLFLASMILYFLMSIIDAAVQEHLAAVHEEEVALERKKHEEEEKKSGKKATGTASVVDNKSKKVKEEPESESKAAPKSPRKASSERPPSPTRRSARQSNTKKDK